MFMDFIKAHLKPNGKILVSGLVEWSFDKIKTFIEKELKITDPEILTAIKRHTTADVEMTTLDKIVFVADFIEPGRDFPGVEEARKVAFANLDDGVGFELAHTLDFLITNRKKIYPKTFAAYNKWAVKD